MRRVLVALPLLAALGCGAAAPTAGPKPAPKTEPLVPKTATPPLAKAPAPRPPEPEPEPPTFDSVWAEARQLIDRREKDAEAKTTQVVKTLTAGERDRAKVLIAIFRETPGFASEPNFTRELDGYRLSHVYRAASARVSKGDSEFHKVMKGIWWSGVTASAVADAAEVWLTFNPAIRSQVGAAVEFKAPTRDLTPLVRDAVLSLGGGRWLAR